MILSIIPSSYVDFIRSLIAATAVPTTLLMTLMSTPTAVIVQITGNVYLRDEQGKVVGWLCKDEGVQADCSGNWCEIISGNYSGYLFWRGCSSDNPQRRSCQAKQQSQMLDYSSGSSPLTAMMTRFL